MKKSFTLLVALLVLSFAAFSQEQKIDTVRVQNLDLQTKTFCENLDKFVQGTKNTENIETINQLSLKIYTETIVLIDSINDILKLDDTDDGLITAGMYSGLAGAFGQSYPYLSVVYTSLASSAILNGEIVPKYYSDIKEIRDITERMSRNKKIERLKKLLNRVSKLNEELKKE